MYKYRGYSLLFVHGSSIFQIVLKKNFAVKKKYISAVVRFKSFFSSAHFNIKKSFQVVQFNVNKNMQNIMVENLQYDSVLSKVRKRIHSE